MTFSLLWSTKPRKFVERLPPQDAQRLFRKFDEIKEDPFRFAKHYEGPCFKIRIGDFRALIDIDVHKNLIEVQHIEKRENIY